MSNQRGEAAAKLLLLLLVVAIAGAVASPWLLRSRRNAEQLAAVQDLKTLHAAQQTQYGASQLYADIDRLVNAKMIAADYQSKTIAPRGYALNLSTDGTRKRFCAEMVAKGDGVEAPTFAIAETGIVQEFPAGASPCYYVVLQSAGTPVR